MVWRAERLVIDLLHGTNGAGKHDIRGPRRLTGRSACSVTRAGERLVLCGVRQHGDDEEGSPQVGSHRDSSSGSMNQPRFGGAPSMRQRT